YSTDSTVMIGYLAFDANDSTKRPGILVVHEWWGHNEYSRQRAEMLAELGYVALAVDMYGDGKQAAHPDEAGEFAGMVMGNFDEAKARFDAALETLKNHPNVDNEKIGAIGYCFGGSVVLSMANSGYDLDAVASFHGGLRLPVMPDSGAVKSRVLVANGAEDPFVPEQQIEDFKSTMDAAGADYKFINYEGATHSFTSKVADSVGAKFDMPLAYNAEADSASWAEMKELFAEAFK
ncbi:MAG: dienelactone hydrolase family protein, partial [Marinoscillum sp.]